MSIFKSITEHAIKESLKRVVEKKIVSDMTGGDKISVGEAECRIGLDGCPSSGVKIIAGADTVIRDTVKRMKKDSPENTTVPKLKTESDKQEMTFKLPK